MSVGIAHLAATVNTLVFAYLGAGLPVVVLLAVQVHRLDLAINDEHIAVEVVRTVVGAIGVLSAVPLTTAIAAWWAGSAGSERRSIPRFLMARPLLAGVARSGSEVAIAAAAPADVGLAPPAPVVPAAEEPLSAADEAKAATPAGGPARRAKRPSRVGSRKPAGPRKPPEPPPDRA
jgi:hypothetical protein